MDLAVQATPARWWYAHKENIASWDNIKRLMAIRFSDDRKYVQHKYIGETDPEVHIQTCEQNWSNIPEDECVHRHIGHSSKELVHRDRVAQGDDHMVTYDRQFPTYLCI